MRNKKKKNERERERRRGSASGRGEEEKEEREMRRNRARENGDGSTVIRVTNFPLIPFASLCSTVWTRLIINTHIRFWKTRLGVSWGWETFFFFFKSSTRRIFALFLAVSKLLSKTSFSMFSPSGFFFSRWSRWFLVSRGMVNSDSARILNLMYKTYRQYFRKMHFIFDKIFIHEFS